MSLLILPFFAQLTFVVCVGLVLGSFANVIIYRLPKGESVISPRSRCQKCLQPIRWFENIPLVSYLFLRGKCNRCGVRISPRYFVVEALMGLGFGALFWWHGPNFYFVEHAIFYFGLLTVSMIDIDHMILPDSFTLSGIVIGLVGSLFNSGRGFTEAFVGVLMGGGFLWLVAYLYYVWRKQEGMGGGDIKLLAWIGAVLGWTAIPFVILIACFFGSLVGIAVSFRSKQGMKTMIPFGPYLAFGAVLYIFGGSYFGELYIRFFLPSLVP